MHKGKVSKMRPTQICVGFAETAAKRTELDALTPTRLDDYLLAHSLPCVLGPEEHTYLVDHHHMGLALTQMGHEECYFNVIHDLSTVAESKFLKVLQVLELLYPHGPDGELLPMYQIPHHLSDLRDDPYRSLAGFVRKRGGFFKVDVPYMEFKWADFFRSRVVIGADFAPAIAAALVLAVSDDARNLPGFAA